jgi:hypothetical protein
MIVGGIAAIWLNISNDNVRNPGAGSRDGIDLSGLRAGNGFTVQFQGIAHGPERDCSGKRSGQPTFNPGLP